MCFTGLFIHGVLPPSMISVVLVPIVKNKRISICSKSNYRPIALAQSRATSGPRARSGPRRPSVRPATLLGNNIAIRPAKPQPTKAGLMSVITSRECTNSEHFGRPREQRCTLRRLLIKYKNSKSRCRQTNRNNYNVDLSHALAYLQRAQVTVSHNPISSSK